MDLRQRVGLAMAAVALAVVPMRAEPKPGDMAPQFYLRGSDGKMYRLSDYRGKQAVVLAWFAKAFTSG
jgi:thioredoxin-dependent peroxiredoxin